MGGRLVEQDDVAALEEGIVHHELRLTQCRCRLADLSVLDPAVLTWQKASEGHQAAIWELHERRVARLYESHPD